ncbi:DUF6538 domain-containing protein [Hyphomonas sp.]|uniref:DUF6538 domain-containing protein n=1 Tax=Hyphomonas sp. TaxID=87 RepID=UPI0030F531DC
MSRRGHKYLCRRGDIFQLRLPVPKELHLKLRRKELRWTLGTEDKRKAIRMSLQAALAFHDLCDNLRRMKDVSQDLAEQIARKFYEELCAAWSPYQDVHPADYKRLLNKNGAARADLFASLEDQIVRRDFPPSEWESAKVRTEAFGKNFDHLSKLEQLQVLEGMAKARIEFLNFDEAREVSLLDAYQPKDILFASASPVQSIAIGTSVQPNLTTDDPSRHLSMLVAVFLERGSADGISGSGPWKQKTTNEIERTLKWFVELVGPTTPVTAISNDHVREFKDGILRLQRGSYSEQSFIHAQTSDKSLQVSKTTAKKAFGWVKTFLNWLANESYLTAAPGAKLSISKQQKSSSDERRKFSPVELNRIVSSPIFTGSKSEKRRYEPGSYQCKDDWYWLLLMLFYTGVRLNEALQIKARFVDAEGKFPHFEFDGKHQDLKTFSSDRIVPMHPDLIAMGFATFVNRRKKEDPEARLLRGITSNSELSNYASQRLGRYLDRIGVDDELVTIHSFRHGFKDALRDAMVPDTAIDKMTGHSTKSVAAEYGSGASLATMSEYLGKANFGLSDAVKSKLMK